MNAKSLNNRFLLFQRKMVSLGVFFLNRIEMFTLHLYVEYMYNHAVLYRLLYDVKVYSLYSILCISQQPQCQFNPVRYFIKGLRKVLTEKFIYL